jgi:hypothetical protein
VASRVIDADASQAATPLRARETELLDERMQHRILLIAGRAANYPAKQRRNKSAGGSRRGQGLAGIMGGTSGVVGLFKAGEQVPTSACEHQARAYEPIDGKSAEIHRAKYGKLGLDVTGFRLRVEGSQEPRRGDTHKGDFIRQLQGAALTESLQFLLSEAARVEAMSEGVLIAWWGTAFAFHLHSSDRDLPRVYRTYVLLSRVHELAAQAGGDDT